MKASANPQRLEILYIQYCSLANNGKQHREAKLCKNCNTKNNILAHKAAKSSIYSTICS